MTTIAGHVEAAAKVADDASIRKHLATLAAYLERVQITYE